MCAWHCCPAFTSVGAMMCCHLIKSIMDMFEVQWYWVEVTPVVNAGFLFFFFLCLLWFADPKSQFTEHLSLIPFACRCRWRNVVKERQDKGSEPQTKVIRHSCPSLQANKARVTATEGPFCPRKVSFSGAWSCRHRRLWLLSVGEEGEVGLACQCK